jgi:hypothetical protein
VGSTASESKKSPSYGMAVEQINSSEASANVYKDIPEDLRKELQSEELQKEIQESLIDLHFEKTRVNVMEHCGSLPMLKMLVGEFGANIDYVDSSGYWPLSSVP